MFNLFRKNPDDQLPPAEVREWIEKNFLSLVNWLGDEYVRNKKVLLPGLGDFPVEYDGAQKSAFETLKIVGAQMDIAIDDISLHFYNEGPSAVETGGIFDYAIVLRGIGEKQSTGVFLGKNGEGQFIIGIEEKTLADPLALIGTLAHELCHAKLMSMSGMYKTDEFLTDMLTILFGFGVFNANTAFREERGLNSWSVSRTGYLNQVQWGYALALFAYWLGDEDPGWSHLLAPGVFTAFTTSASFIWQNADAIFTQEYDRERIVEEDDASKRVIEQKEERNSNQFLDTFLDKLATDPQNPTLLNNAGYCLLQQKKYVDAIVFFDKAISAFPKFDFPYNNRGYCKLQLGDKQSAYEDIEKACEMNPFNSFAWRNLGAYYLEMNEPSKALEYFEEAEKLDGHTELINFYLYKAHHTLGNMEQAKEYIDRSVALGEYNDSLIV